MNDEQIAVFLRSELEKIRANKIEAKDDPDKRMITATVSVAIFERMAEVFIGHVQLRESDDIK